MISIIMPLYNAERFLYETLQSIQKQTFTDYELICINDCSTDRTVEIVNKEIRNDRRIKLIHNDVRSGAAISRNKGIEKARGEYLSFLDGDDIFEEEMLERAYECAKKNDLDIVIFEYLGVVSEEIYLKRKISRNIKFKEKFCVQPFCLYDIEPLDYIQWSLGPWNKLFKKEFVLKHRLQFQTLSCCNDVYFVDMSYILAQKIMFLNDERVMVYVRKHYTPSRISFNRDPMCSYEACKKIMETLAEKELVLEKCGYFYLRIYTILLLQMLDAKVEKNKENFYKYLHDKGIMELIKMGEEPFYEFYMKDHDYLSKFVELEYQTKWFENESIVSIVLRSDKNDIWRLWTQYKNISIWGAGIYGKSLLKLVSEKKLKICNVIDKNLEKAGMRIGEYIIQNPEEVAFNNINLVIVAAKEGYKQVKELLKKYNLIVVDINEYL